MAKPIVGCIVAGGLAFLFIALQIGLIGPNRESDADENDPDGAETRSVEKKKKETPPVQVATKFPEDLAPAARALPVEKAVAYTSGDRIHKMVFLRVNGALHNWHQTHEDCNEEWCSNRVEETELAIIVGNEKKLFVDRTRFNQGPPVERFRWEVEASVVEAKTGKVLAHRTFVNMPRTIRKLEDYGLTSIGQPVTYRTVFNWVTSNSKVGFPIPIASGPVVTVVGD